MAKRKSDDASTEAIHNSTEHQAPEEKQKKRQPLQRVKRKATDLVKFQCMIPLELSILIDFKARLDGLTRSQLVAKWGAEKTSHLNKGNEASDNKGNEASDEGEGHAAA